jgi:hypothetical protein
MVGGDSVNRSYNPPVPLWICWFCEQMTVVCLVAYVLALYDGRWSLAICNAGWTLMNVLNAYFNRLSLSARMALVRRAQFWRKLPPR